MTSSTVPAALTRRPILAGAVALFGALGPLALIPAHADDRSDLVDRAHRALDHLEADDPRAGRLSRHARAVLVFPSVLKAGFVFGGESGNGVLFMPGERPRFFNLSGGSWGLQIGAQDFGYALFFMTNESIHYLRDAAGFAAGSLPSLVVVNQGAAANIDTTTALHDVYAFPFNQKGLMANLTLEGTKITPIHPD
jgi:lipid-binding SYLF domain-containing protein